MKKLLISALSLLAFAGAQAANFQVWNEGEQNESLTFYNWHNINYETVDNPSKTITANYNKVLKISSADGSSAASFGLLLSDDKMKTGMLASGSINCKFYVEGNNATYSIRLTSENGVTQDYQIFPNQYGTNAWLTSALPIKDYWENVSDAWNAGKGNGEGYVFSIVMENATSEDAIYFANIYYDGVNENWTAPEIVTPKPTTVPVPEHDATNVLSFFGHYGNNVSFNFSKGGWGESTKADYQQVGEQSVIYLTNFNYIGLVDFSANVADYDYMHVDYWTPDDKAPFGFTPISVGPKEVVYTVPEVKVAEWNSYDVPMSTWSSVVDLANLFQMKFVANQNEGLAEEGYIANIYFWKDPNKQEPVDPDPDQPEEPGEAGATWYGSVSYPDPAGWQIDYKFVTNEDKTFTVYANIVNKNNVLGLDAQYGADGMGIVHFESINDGEYNYKATSESKYENGVNTHFFFYLASQAGGDPRMDVEYIYGSSNEKPVKVPTIVISNVKVDEIGEDFATLIYEMSVPDELSGYEEYLTVYYYEEPDGEWKSTEGSITINNLTPNTSYSYTITAKYSEEVQVEYKVETASINFTTTLPEGEEFPVFEGQFDLILNDCQVNGQAGQTVETVIYYTITYNQNKTLTVEFYPSNDDYHNIVGRVSKLFFDGEFFDVFEQINRANVKAYAVNDKPIYYTKTSSKTYEPGDNVNIQIGCDYAGGSAISEKIPYTVGLANENTGVADVAVESEMVDVYSLSGIRVAKDVKFEEVKGNLTPGLYIVGGKKLIVR